MEEEDPELFLFFRIEIETVMKLEHPIKGELSDDEWARMVGLMCQTLNRWFSYSARHDEFPESMNSWFRCSIAKNETEIRPHEWQIMREFTIRDKDDNHIPNSLKIVSPLPYWGNGRGIEPHIIKIWRSHLKGVFRAFRDFDCEASSSCATRVHVALIPPLATDEPTTGEFTLDHIKSLAKAMLRYAGPLTDFAKSLNRDCMLPWNLEAGDDLTSVWSRIETMQSREELVAYMCAGEQDDPSYAVPRRRMWDFSAIIDKGTIQCWLGPASTIQEDAETWITFACSFVIGALIFRGNVLSSGDDISVSQGLAAISGVGLLPELPHEVASRESFFSFMCSMWVIYEAPWDNKDRTIDAVAFYIWTELLDMVSRLLPEHQRPVLTHPHLQHIKICTKPEEQRCFDQLMGFET